VDSTTPGREAPRREPHCTPVVDGGIKQVGIVREHVQDTVPKDGPVDVDTIALLHSRLASALPPA
jgi:hypothetical protein